MPFPYDNEALSRKHPGLCSNCWPAGSALRSLDPTNRLCAFLKSSRLPSCIEPIGPSEECRHLIMQYHGSHRSYLKCLLYLELGKRVDTVDGDCVQSRLC